MKRSTKIIISSLIIALGGYAVVFSWQNLRGVGPVIKKPPHDITDIIPPSDPITNDEPNDQSDNDQDEPKDVPPAVNNTKFPLKLPAGFEISIFADGIGSARDMALDGDGNMWVSQRQEGKIQKLTINSSVVVEKKVMLSGLNNPHGLAFDPDNPYILFFAEQDKISRYDIKSQNNPKKIIDLPSGGNHKNYSLRFGPDGRLYIALGSTCNACIESDPRRGTIHVLNKDGSDFKEFAKGLRNAAFITFHPKNNSMWATGMGRDFLGDDLPPDEINNIEEGKNYGWPNCYGKNIHDTDFDKSVYVRAPCSEPFETPSVVDIPAHSAPLGLGFIPEEGWPKEYHNDLIVAYHGSWNRSTPTGYKVVRMKFDGNGNYSGTEDFISGWLTGEGALGRPVGILIQPNGVMYISDDKAAVIYRVVVKN